MSTKLSVNINKIATLRNTRPLGIPSVIRLAQIALDAGAQGITIHPRPDQRHIREADVGELAALLKKYPRAEFNIEGNPFHDFLRHIRAARPAQCTLVPDEIAAPTSNSGWSLSGPGAQNLERLRPLIAKMRALGCRVSLFMDADSPDFALVPQLGAQRIELYTEPFAAAFLKGGAARADSLALYARAAEKAAALGLAINAGHDLNLQNLPPFLRHVPHVEEVSIGHALIADALEFGLDQTVRKYLAACQPAPH